MLELFTLIRFDSSTGDTAFPSAAEGACAGDIISYTTQSQKKPLTLEQIF